LYISYTPTHTHTHTHATQHAQHTIHQHSTHSTTQHNTTPVHTQRTMQQVLQIFSILLTKTDKNRVVVVHIPPNVCSSSIYHTMEIDILSLILYGSVALITIFILRMTVLAPASPSPARSAAKKTASNNHNAPKKVLHLQSHNTNTNNNNNNRPHQTESLL